MSENKPPPGVTRVRNPLDEQSSKRKAPNGLWTLLLAVITIGLLAMAFYMAFIVRHPLTSPYVLAPSVGVVWFGLRLFMSFAPKR